MQTNRSSSQVEDKVQSETGISHKRGKLMAVLVGLMGFGRIGRNVFRILYKLTGCEFWKALEALEVMGEN